MPILKQKNVKNTEKVAVPEGFKPKVQVNNKSSLFASFSASSKAASWSTFASMSYEAALKATKKIIKNQNFIITG